MASWKNININSNQIKAETDRALLIAMPHNSQYDGYVFWHTSKLIRSGKHSASVLLSYNDNFTFNLKKYGKGKYNSHDVIDETTIDVEEFENAFGVINENITKKKFKKTYETHKPQEIEAKEVNALDELKDE